MGWTAQDKRKLAYSMDCDSHNTGARSAKAESGVFTVFVFIISVIREIRVRLNNPFNLCNPLLI